MPITINGTGTVTGISAGGLPDSCITTDDIAANAVTAAKLGADQASGLAKAWVNFNGTGTVAIRASFNVSSITDNGTGDYTVNFTTALADANYCTNVSGIEGGANGTVSKIGSAAPYTSSAVRVTYCAATGPALDVSIACIAIFR
jgi:hypothetical protein